MPIYPEFYSLLHEYIYGLDNVLTNYQDLTLTVLATMGCLFIVGLPFVLVWRVIRIWF